MFSFNIMECRYESLIQAISGYKKTGHFFAFYDFATGLWGGGSAEALGIYYFIPKLASFFNIHLDLAIMLFFGCLIFIAAFLSSFFFFLLYRQPKLAIFTVFIFFCSALIAFINGGIYSFHLICWFMCVPFILYLFSSKRDFWILSLAVFSISIIASYSNLCRDHSGTVVFLFLLIIITSSKNVMTRNKVLILILMLAGYLVPQYHFKTISSQSEFFLRDNYKIEINKYKGTHRF